MINTRAILEGLRNPSSIRHSSRYNKRYVMFKLTVDDEISLRILHPDDSGELFALLEKNRSRLRPWIHPSALPETAQGTRIFTIECYFNSMEDPMDALDSPYFKEVGRYFRGFAQPQMEMGIWMNGRLAGEVSLSFQEDSPDTAEFGYWVGAEHEGKGIITRCVRALMDYAITHLKVERFVIGCAEENYRSRAVPERLGYHLQDMIPGGEVIGAYVYNRLVFGIQSTEWSERLQTKVHKT